MSFGTFMITRKEYVGQGKVPPVRGRPNPELREKGPFAESAERSQRPHQSYIQKERLLEKE